MPNIDLKKLPTAAEPKPANVEIEAPPPALEAEMAARSKAASLAAQQAMREPSTKRQTPPALLRANTAPPPPPPPVSTDELAVIKQRAREYSNPSRGEFKVEAPLAAACSLIYDKIGSMSAEWGQKLDAMRIERGLRRDQIVCALIANSLDTNMHMVIPADHPYFSENFRPGGTNFNCIMCGSPQSRSYPGQPPICISPDNKCANRFNALPDEDKKELLEAAG